jgi:hypothetical protein
LRIRVWDEHEFDSGVYSLPSDSRGLNSGIEVNDSFSQ